MKTIKIFAALATLLLVGGIFTVVHAQTFNQKTYVTFNHPVEVPGKVLPAGKYGFQLAETSTYRHVVQIFNEDGTELITTVMAIPDYRLTASDKTVVEFDERAAGTPPALRAWFYPANNFGQEFVYPKARAAELAKASNEVVPAEAVELTPRNFSRIPLIAITPEQKQEPVTEAIQTTPEPVQVAQNTLPKTASPVPLVALIGGAFVIAGFSLRRLAKQNS